eukprot:TRINITY_DN198_c0_g1_i2.p1 TRINITY_DN198_c0_g1~~TRINITY_DN198_c0_g1_i2.p1  ORF type:complete len:610 (-),score=31.15 TRINITY_DN198_c0_g1_i2:35-1864(-)
MSIMTHVRLTRVVRGIQRLETGKFHIHSRLPNLITPSLILMKFTEPPRQRVSVCLDVMETRKVVPDLLQHSSQLSFSEWCDVLGRFTSAKQRLPRCKDLFEGRKLGMWAQRQRKLYAIGSLPQEHVEELEKNPFWTWSSFSEWCDVLGRFTSAKQRLPRWKDSFEGRRLGVWAQRQRKLYAIGSLPQEHVEELEKNPFWTSTADTAQLPFSEWCDVLGRFTSAKQRLPRCKDLFEGRKLGMWVQRQRKLYAIGSLPQEHVEELEKNPFWTWSSFSEWCDVLGRFTSAKQRLPRLKDSFEGRKLGMWAQRQRKLYAIGSLPQEHVEELEKNPFWTSTADTAQLHFSEWCDVLGRFTSAKQRLPRWKDLFEGRRLGMWAQRQRKLYAIGSLPQEHVEELEKNPFWTWSRSCLPTIAPQHGRYTMFEDLVKAVTEFVQVHARLPHASEHWRGMKVGQWISTQRALYRHRHLTANRIAMIEKIPMWTWAGRLHKGFDFKIALLRHFVSQYNRLPLPDEHMSGVELGKWVHRLQQRRYVQSIPNQQELESVSFWSWDSPWKIKARALAADEPLTEDSLDDSLADWEPVVRTTAPNAPPRPRRTLPCWRALKEKN